MRNPQFFPNPRPNSYFQSDLVPIKRSQQITDSHCGPAVLQMLFSSLGIEVSQDEVVHAAGVERTIAEHGMTVPQLARAVSHISPYVKFWYKEYAKIEDIMLIVLEHRFPVGVEWQGLFESIEDTEENYEDDEEGYGHYSIISHVDVERKQLIIVDPYKDFISQDRIFTFEEFLPRWWDTNEVKDPQTRRAKIVIDNQMLFLLTSSKTLFPSDLGFLAP